MKKWMQRILVFFIGVPLIITVILLLPHYHHLVFNAIVILFSAFGAAEFSVMLSQKNLRITRAEALVFGALAPLVMYLIISLDFSVLLFPAVIAASISWLLLWGILSKGDALDSFINRFAAGLAVFLYPGMLMVWVVRMSRWESMAGIAILIFVSAVFISDAAAWTVGMLFGRGNQGVIPASPNKSVAGFLGGTAAPVLVGVCAVLLCPELFVPKWNLFSGAAPVPGAILGFLTGAAAVLGDLGESAIKRSSGLKDSGNIIPGRGGVLDSIDSLALAAPVFYIAYSLLFVRP